MDTRENRNIKELKSPRVARILACRAVASGESLNGLINETRNEPMNPHRINESMDQLLYESFNRSCSFGCLLDYLLNSLD